MEYIDYSPESIEFRTKVKQHKTYFKVLLFSAIFFIIFFGGLMKFFIDFLDNRVPEVSINEELSLDDLYTTFIVDLDRVLEEEGYLFIEDVDKRHKFYRFAIVTLGILTLIYAYISTGTTMYFIGVALSKTFNYIKNGGFVLIIFSLLFFYIVFVFYAIIGAIGYTVSVPFFIYSLISLRSNKKKLKKITLSLETE